MSVKKLIVVHSPRSVVRYPCLKCNYLYRHVRTYWPTSTEYCRCLLKFTNITDTNTGNKIAEYKIRSIVGVAVNWLGMLKWRYNPHGFNPRSYSVTTFIYSTINFYSSSPNTLVSVIKKERKRIISEHISENRRPTPQFRSDTLIICANKGEKKQPVCMGAFKIFPYFKIIYPFETSSKQEATKHSFKNVRVIFSNISFTYV